MPSKSRFTVHLSPAVIEKLRDVVSFRQNTATKEIHSVESVSVFVERAIIEEIERTERAIGKSVPKRKRQVHFGRPRTA